MAGLLLGSPEFQTAVDEVMQGNFVGWMAFEYGTQCGTIGRGEQDTMANG